MKTTILVWAARMAGTVQRGGPTAAIICLLALWALAQVSLPALCQAVYTSPYTFTTLAGKSRASIVGNKTPWHFKPKSIAVDAKGIVYFADASKHIICRIMPSG